jgi:hypothetical protein
MGPGTVPVPPSMAMITGGKLTSRPKAEVGSTWVSCHMYTPPARPGRNALSTNTARFTTRVSTPDVSATSSSSRMLTSPRPSREWATPAFRPTATTATASIA